MSLPRRPAPGAPPADPFQERRVPALHERMQLLGGQFHFETDSPPLLRIVRLAYAGLPPHRLPGPAPRCLVRLALASSARTRRTASTASEPPQVRPLAGGGILCGAMQDASFAALTPQRRSALLAVSHDMLKFTYHLRYELLEFAVYVLASRVQGLVPLHAACVGRFGRGILLLGPSGSGKSTLSLHCLLQGLDFLAEDSVLVEPRGLLATGVANFLHLRPDSLRFLRDADRRGLVREADIIRRRSGVEKFELDLRHPRYRLAPAPLRIAAVVFASSRISGAGALLKPMGKADVTRRLAACQQYAANQPGWDAFVRGISRLPAFVLNRGRHPLQAVEALQTLLPAGAAVTPGRRNMP